MSFALPINPFPAGIANRALSPDDVDELERRQRIKRAASTQVDDAPVDRGEARAMPAGGSGIVDPTARLYNPSTPQRVTFQDVPPAPQPTIGRAPVVDVSPTSDGVFRRAGQAPAPDTLSLPTPGAPMRATYEPPASNQPAVPLDRQHVDFSQGNPMDALAVQRAGVSQQPFASDVDEGPATRRAREMGAVGAEPHKHGSGVGERLMHGLKLGGTALLRSGNPLIAAGEFVEGAIDPNAWHRFEFNRDYPRAVTAAHNEQGMQEANMQRAQQQATMTGEYAPGMPTEAARSRHVQQDFNRIKLQEQDALKQQTINEQKRNHEAETARKTTADQNRAASQRLNTLRHVWEAGGMDEAQRAEFAQLAGLHDALSEAYLKGEADIQPDEKGRVFVVHKRTGHQEPVVDPETGQQMVSFKVTEEANKTARASATQDRIDARATMRGAGTRRMTHAQAATQAAKEMGAGADGMIDNPVWKHAYDENYAIADYEKDEAKRQAIAAKQADRAVKAGKRIPANKHPEFQMRVNKILSEGGQGSDSLRGVQVGEYQKRIAKYPARKEEIRQAFKVQFGYDPEQ